MDDVRAFGARHMSRFQSQLDIAIHGAPGQQCTPVVLEHNGQFRLRRAHLLTFVNHFASGGQEQTCQHAQQGRFTAPRGPHDAQKLVRMDVQLNAFENFQVIDLEIQRADGKDRI